MKAFNVGLSDVQEAVDAANEYNGWDGNLIVDPDYDETSTNRGPRLRFRLRVKDSKMEPARYSTSNRRTIHASWEAHRDVMRTLFDMGATRIKTAFIDYVSAEDFEDRHGDTYYHNAGSMMFPVSFGELTL
jgi:hypothetical protein